MAKIQHNANQLTAPRWAGDFMSPERLIPGGARLDAAQFHGNDSFLVTINDADVNAGETSFVIVALPGALPADTILEFPDGFAKTSADHAAGVTTLNVDALFVDMANAGTAQYEGTELETVVSGTLIGRTIAERDANTGYGPAADADDEIHLVAFDVVDVTNNPDVDLYRHGGVVYENYLPVFSALSSALKAKIRSLYESSIGRD